MINYLGVSRRDLGAGVAASGSALLAAVLFNLWNFIQTFRVLGFDSASIAEYRRLGNDIFLLAILVAPVIAAFVATAVWRVIIPDEPAPNYGALAGVVSAVGSLFVYAALIGIMLSWSQLTAGAVAGAVSEFALITGIITIFGGVVTVPFIAPIGALVGYGYERYLAGG